MPSSFSQNTGLELLGNGEQAGLWGEATNRNMEIIDRQLSGSTVIGLAGTTHTLTTSSGTLSDGQYSVITFTGVLGETNTVTIAPNTAQRVYFFLNATNQTVVLTQGSGGSVSVASGTSVIVYTTGGGAAAGVVNIANTLAMGNVRITGGSIAGATITGGTVTGITDLAVADGGTGASTPEAALVNLGLTATAAQLNPLPATVSTLQGDVASLTSGVGGVTASSDELNILDGATVTTAELNALDGVTPTGTAVIRAATQGAGRDALGLPDFTISTSAPSGGTDGDVWFQY